MNQAEMNEADLRRLEKLHAMLGSQHKGERENARQRIIDLLTKHGKSWNDLLGLLSRLRAHAPEPHPPKTGMPHPHPLDLIARLLERYVHLTDDAQRIALALWVAHTFIYARFSVTPRLAILSPVRGCGKTTCLSLIEALALNAIKADNTTPAALFRIIDSERGCVLLDEVDNQGLLINPGLRAVINSGHASNGWIMRYEGGVARRFTTFAPLALVAIGILPLPILHRSIVIQPEQQRMCDVVYNKTLEWARETQFDADPPMPKLHNRAADNWRVCFAIADAASKEWASAARAAAIELSSGQEEDMGVQLLLDIREIFDRLMLDRIGSGRLVGELADLPDGRWSEWHGVKGNNAPHPLTQGGLAQMLAPFGIRQDTNRTPVRSWLALFGTPDSKPAPPGSSSRWHGSLYSFGSGRVFRLAIVVTKSPAHGCYAVPMARVVLRQRPSAPPMTTKTPTVPRYWTTGRRRNEPNRLRETLMVRAL
jgi:Protein of unknown function (DUF3631)